MFGNSLRGLVFLTLAALAPLPARAADLPKGEEILDKYVVATGGKEAYEKIKSRISSGTMEFPGLGVKGKITVSQAAPKKFRLEVDLAGVAKIDSGSDGQTAWEVSSLQGPRLLKGDEKANALLDADFYGDLNWRKVYKKVECVKEETVEGKPCYVVEQTTNAGQVRTVWYDQKSNLVVRTAAKVNTPMGELATESATSDYKKVDGILIPHKVKTKVGPQEFVIVFDKIEHNVNLPDSKFEMPDEIKKLVDKEKKEKPKE